MKKRELKTDSERLDYLREVVAAVGLKLDGLETQTSLDCQKMLAYGLSLTTPDREVVVDKAMQSVIETLSRKPRADS